jgi:hypothetical protein
LRDSWRFHILAVVETRRVSSFYSSHHHALPRPIARLQRVLDNDADYVTSEDMPVDLAEDNRSSVVSLRGAFRLRRGKRHRNREPDRELNRPSRMALFETTRQAK